jgi:hypothetical protein
LLLLWIIDPCLPWPVVCLSQCYDKHCYFTPSALGSYLDSWYHNHHDQHTHFSDRETNI